MTSLQTDDDDNGQVEHKRPQDSSRSSPPFAVMRYTTAIQVVVATRSSKQQIVKNAQHDGRLCVDSWERYLRSIYPISTISNDEEDDDTSSNTNTITAHHVVLNHPIPQSTIGLPEKLCGNDDDDDYVGMFSSPPMPLLSVAFSVYPDPPLLSWTMSSQRLALLQSCLKRQLVACPLIWKKDDDDDNNGNETRGGGLVTTTKVTLELLGRTWTLQVESITVVGRRSSSMGNCSTPPTTPATRAPRFGSFENNILFTILPSTRITFSMTTMDTTPSEQAPVMSTTKEQPNHLYSGIDKQKTQEEQHVSPTSRLLAETLQCCSRFTTRSTTQERQPAQQQQPQQGSSLPFPSCSSIDIPRSFLLSGPPGVGKSFSVQMAISSFFAQSSSSLMSVSSASPPKCHFISLRGSDILAETATSGSAGGAASIALKRHFHDAIHWLQKDDATRTHASTEAANCCSVALIFLDECDALLASSSMSDTAGNMTAAMLAFLLDCMNQPIIMSNDNDNHMDSSSSTWCSPWKRLVVVAATNRIDSIPATLRRSGRFDCEIPMGPPNVMERAAILSKLIHGCGESYVPTTTIPSCSSSEMTGTITTKEKSQNDSGFVISPQELFEVAADCVGYVAADLAALVRRATLLALSTSSDVDTTTLPSVVVVVTVDFLRRAMSDMVASALRDAALHAPPTTTWNDIAGTAGGAKTTLRQAMEWPRLRRDAFRALGLQPPRGILLFGPPGCAKSTLARAAAGSAGVAFLSLSPADVYASSYVGEAEAVVRRAFCLARSAAPCVLFFDEIDAILGCNDDATSGSRSGGMSRNTGSSAEARVLSTFLNEMDGIDIGSSSSGLSCTSNGGGGADNTGGVLVLGATNRPWTLDAALLRPGRFDKKILVPPPDWQGRREILEMQTQTWTISACQDDDDDDGLLNLDVLADKSAGMTGAEIVGACQSASHKALCEVIDSDKSASMNIRIDEDPSFQRRQQELLLEALRNVKPLLVSNPSILRDFELFKSGG